MRSSTLTSGISNSLQSLLLSEFRPGPILTGIPSIVLYELYGTVYRQPRAYPTLTISFGPRQSFVAVPIVLQFLAKLRRLSGIIHLPVEKRFEIWRISTFEKSPTNHLHLSFLRRSLIFCRS
jgi:hypothetical protein